LEGERGSGRTRLGQSVAQFVSPERSVAILREDDFGNADDFVTAFELETDSADFAVIVANVDELADEVLEPLAAVMQARAGRGGIDATKRREPNSALGDRTLLRY